MYSNKEVDDTRDKKLWLLILAFAIFGMLMSMLSGCATAKPEYDTQGNIVGVTSYGFLRDVKVEQVKADGSKILIETKSTSSDIMKAGNEILGTMVNGASKVMP